MSTMHKQTLKKQAALNAETLREKLDYNPDTGIFTWIKPNPYWRKPRLIAGSTNKLGYVIIHIDRRLYKAHRLAWLYMTGEWPTKNIDHINCAASDNRWVNLREADQSQNNANARLRSNNKSGLKGVSWCKSMNRWIAQIKHQHKVRTIGFYADPEEAHQAYRREAERLHGEFARFA